jgi:hypothetical protein
MIFKKICVYIFCDNDLYHHVNWWLNGKGLGFLQKRRWFNPPFENHDNMSWVLIQECFELVFSLIHTHTHTHT